MAFNVGDKVKLKVANRSRAYIVANQSQIVTPDWHDDLSLHYVWGTVLTVVGRDWSGCPEIEDAISGQIWSVHEDWIELANCETLELTFDEPACGCFILSGCTCGVMQREMEAKGKIFCSFTKLWYEKPGSKNGS